MSASLENIRPIDLLFDAVARSTLVDITHPLKAGLPVWPGHPGLCQTAMAAIERGDASCYHALALGEHTGTHFDAPLHFVLGGPSIAAVPPERFFGRMVTVAATGLAPSTSLGPEAILAWEGRHGHIAPHDAVFLHFGWDRFWDVDPAAFLQGWPGLSGAAAALLVARGVRVVGSDCLSIDPFTSSDFRPTVP